MLNLDDIKSKILSEIEKINHSTYSHSDAYLICKNYLQNNKLTKAEHFKDIDIWECIKCIYLLKNKSNKSVDEINEIFKTFRLCFKDADYTLAHYMFAFIIRIPNSKEEQAIYNYLNERSSIKALIKLSELYKIYDFKDLGDNFIDYNNIEAFLSIMRDMNIKGYNILSIINLFRDEKQLMIDICALIVSYKKMNDDYNNYDKINNTLYFPKDAYTLYNIIPTFVSLESKKEKEYEKEKELTISYYYRLIDRLTKAANEKEITNASELVKLIKNEELKRNVLIYIYFHNKAYYDELKKEVQSLDNNGLIPYKGLLEKYKIEIEFEEINSITHNSLEDVENILNLLSKIFTNQELIQILQYSNLEIVQKIKKYYDLRFLDDDFLRANLDIFNLESNKLNTLELSLSILNEKGINPQLFEHNSSVLITNPKLLEQNLDNLIDYNLIQSLKSALNYEFLLENDLNTKIDYIIELGLYSFLERDLEILNIPLMILKRIELLNALDMPIENIEDFWSIIESEEFIVPDELIDSYISNVAPLMPKLDLSLEILNSIKSDNINLVLGQTTFSLPKVKRKLAEGLTLQDALFYNKNVSLSTYHDITSIFKGITK